MTELVKAAPPRAELLLRAYAKAKARYGSELGQRRLVFPDGRDFPDPFREDEPSAQRLLSRMQRYAGMSDIPITLGLVGSSGSVDSSCGSGACAVPRVPAAANLARVLDEGDRWLVTASPLELKHPIFLTTELARSLGLIFMLEIEEPGDPAASPFTVELMAVMLGFGGLLLQGAHVYQKSCAGPRVDQLTSLSVSELGLLTTVMAIDTSSGPGRLPGLLEATQRAALGEAEEILRAYPRFLRRLSENPALAAEASLEPEKPEGLWTKLKTRLSFEPKSRELSGDDLGAWQRALEEAGASETRRERALPSQELRDLVKSEL